LKLGSSFTQSVSSIFRFCGLNSDAEKLIRLHIPVIGLTLVVAGDSFFITLFIVILFHQMFEGIALGTRIAALGTHDAERAAPHSHGHHHGRHSSVADPNVKSPSSPITAKQAPVSMAKKLLLAAGFAVVTPMGMAIGIGILHQFNGNDPTTIWAIGTLDAFSAGILVWVGVVEMWAEDWMRGGEMAAASPMRAAAGLMSLVAGMVLMSFLGKWA
jgi:solute carrier family 39 (zinc transporter), member 1/2/3